jgi:ATP-binding cassette subfamily F protein 3
MTGALPPSKGTISRHAQLTIGHFSQHSVEALSALPSASSTTALAHFIKYFAEKSEIVEEQEARACLGAMGLQGPTAAQVSITNLSGGQKVRLALALIIFKPPQLLLLDEVTTHVDAPTVEALAKALNKFEGAIVLITHDRWFSRVVVEGTSFKTLRWEHGDDISDDDDQSDVSDGDEKMTKGPRRTYHVGNGHVKELPRGMVQYVELVERRLEKTSRATKQ